MSGIIGGAGKKSGVIIPPIVGCRVQPGGSSAHTLANGSAHTLGWTTTASAAVRGNFIKHITFSASGATSMLDGSNTGMITIVYGGLYYVHCDIRVENDPRAGNITLIKDEAGTTTQRMHVEAWDHHLYMHGTVRGCFDFNAGTRLRFHVSCDGANIQHGAGDTLNFLSIMKMS